MSDDPQASPLWPADNEAVTTHIEALQGIINRLAESSASCKNWCLTLVAALLALAASAHSPQLVTISLVPVIVFGFLDTMYLAQEQSYRDLYKCIVGKIRKKEYALADVYNAKSDKPWKYFLSALKSWSIWPVYSGLIAAYFIAQCAGGLDALTTVTPG